MSVETGGGGGGAGGGLGMGGGGGGGEGGESGVSAFLNEEERLLIINRLHAVLRPFLLRRVKKDVLQDIPERKEYLVRIALSTWQKAVYKQIQEKGLRWVSSLSLQLRKEPLLFDAERVG